jgi:hypothetical protein
MEAKMNTAMNVIQGRKEAAIGSIQSAFEEIFNTTFTHCCCQVQRSGKGILNISSKLQLQKQ